MLNSLTFKISHYFTIPNPGKGLPSFESLIQALSKNHKKGVGERGTSTVKSSMFTTCIKPAVNDALIFRQTLTLIFPCHFSTFASIASFHHLSQTLIFLQ